MGAWKHCAGANDNSALIALLLFPPDAHIWLEVPTEGACDRSAYTMGVALAENKWNITRQWNGLDWDELKICNALLLICRKRKFRDCMTFPASVGLFSQPERDEQGQ